MFPLEAISNYYKWKKTLVKENKKGCGVVCGGVWLLLDVVLSQSL